jgi:hypothetical protein
MIRVSNPGKGKIFSVLRNVLLVSEAHSASSPVRTVVLFPGLRRPVLQSDHSSLSSTEVKNEWIYTFAFPGLDRDMVPAIL